MKKDVIYIVIIAVLVICLALAIIEINNLRKANEMQTNTISAISEDHYELAMEQLKNVYSAMDALNTMRQNGLEVTTATRKENDSAAISD